jgi:alpha-mannosidase
LIETECIFEKSKLIQQILFYKEQDKVEFRTNLNWNELGTPSAGVPMLRVAFPLNILSEKAVYEIPFASIERPNTGQEAPALKWIDYSDGKNGVALLNDCKYGHNVRGNNVELTLVRSAYEPDLNTDCGKHSFTYALYPHEGDWKKADVVKRGYELNMPMVAVVVDNSNSKKDLPTEKSFVKLSAKDVVVSSLKKAENGKGLVMHIYESEGKSSNCSIEFGMNINKVVETNLIEDTISTVKSAKNKIKQNLKKWEIKAYRIIPK